MKKALKQFAVVILIMVYLTLITGAAVELFGTSPFKQAPYICTILFVCVATAINCTTHLWEKNSNHPENTQNADLQVIIDKWEKQVSYCKGNSNIFMTSQQYVENLEKILADLKTINQSPKSK